MPVAKEILYINGVVAALPGNVVTDEAVKTYGWEDKVDGGKAKRPVGRPRANKAETE